MVFFFGIKRNLIAETRLQGCKCQYCDNENTLIASKYGSYFHFFFIPIFPTGKITTVGCTHCSKVYEGSKLSSNVKEAIQKNTVFAQKKRPIWHGCGCVVILILIAFGFLSEAYHNVFYRDEINLQSNISTEKEYQSDVAKLSTTPDCKIDSISCAVKSHLDMVLTNQLEKDNFEYYSEVRGSKVLILVKVPDAKKIKSEARAELVHLIKEGVKQLRSMENKQLYIGVDGFWNTILVETPENKDLNGRFANEEYLYDFYKD